MWPFVCGRAAAVERLAEQLDAQRKEHAAEVEALHQKHVQEMNEQQAAMETLRYHKELAEANVAQKQQQLLAAEAGASIAPQRVSVGGHQP